MQVRQPAVGYDCYNAGRDFCRAGEHDDDIQRGAYRVHNHTQYWQPVAE